MLYVNDKKKYVGTYKEIAIMFISFSIVLFVLYPKDMLNKQILSEKSNYDLSILYLKNMLKNDSSNESLMLALAEQSFNSGNYDLSFNLLKLLKNSKDKQTKMTAYLLSYKLAKNDYFYLKKQDSQEAMLKKHEELQELYGTIIKDKLYREEDTEKLYEEGTFLKDYPSSYILVKKLLAKKPHDETLLSDAYFLLNKMNKHEALADLQKESETSQYWQLKLVDFYIANNQAKNAADVYMKMFHKEKNYKVKKIFFIKAVKIFQANQKLKDATKLTRSYEDYFFNDGKMRIFMLKLYIAAGDLNKARELSKKMLKGRNY